MGRAFGRMVFCSVGTLGDYFVMAGAIRHFAAQCEELHIPTRPQHYKVVSQMFEDVQSISVASYADFADVENKMAVENWGRINAPDVAFVSQDGADVPAFWDEQCYTFYNLPFSTRYNYQLPYNLYDSQRMFGRLTILIPDGKYILTHRKFGLTGGAAASEIEIAIPNPNNYQIIDLDESLTSNILDYTHLIMHATEIHCVPSSVFCMVDSMINYTKAELYYHNIRKSTVMRINNQWNTHRWNIINYDRQL